MKTTQHVLFERIERYAYAVGAVAAMAPVMLCHPRCNRADDFSGGTPFFLSSRFLNLPPGFWHPSRGPVFQFLHDVQVINWLTSHLDAQDRLLKVAYKVLLSMYCTPTS